MATSSDTPSSVVGLDDGVLAIVAGGANSCAIVEDRTVRCWGANTEGQVGDGTTTQRGRPATVVGLTNVRAMSVGGFDHTCALTEAGAVKCWGSNIVGQLGIGTIDHDAHPAPQDVLGFTTGAFAVATGNLHTCAVTTTDTVACWGINREGQLGDGTTMRRSSPTEIRGLKPGSTQLLVGDANCIGAVNSIDAALVLQFVGGVVVSLDCQQNADVNGDGLITAIDAALILQFTAGLLPGLPP